MMDFFHIYKKIDKFLSRTNVNGVIEAEWNKSISTSEITILRTRRNGRERFVMLSSFPAVGGGELALIDLDTSSVSSVITGNPSFSLYSSEIRVNFILIYFT